MSNIRFKALELAMTRPRRQMEIFPDKVSDYFGELTFSREVMRDYMSQEAYHSVVRAAETGENQS
jgi:glutamine synthetase